MHAEVVCAERGCSVHDSKTILVSIKPEYVERILAGEKTVELRRRSPQRVADGGTMLIYETTPRRAIVASCEVVAVETLPLSTLWRRYRDVSGISRQAFNEYYDGCETGVVLKLGEVRSAKRQLGLDRMRSTYELTPPQSFAYIGPALNRRIHDYLKIAA